MKIVWSKFLENIEEEIMEEIDGEIIPIAITKKFLTPMGYMPDDFNMWLGHANFKITPEVYNKILYVPGVEILDVFTPYRFKLAVGLAFDDKAVKREIQKVLGIGKKPVDDIQQNIEEAKKSINMPFWAIYVAPNGQTSLKQSENEEEVYKELEVYETTQKMVGGRVEYHAKC